MKTKRRNRLSFRKRKRRVGGMKNPIVIDLTEADNSERIGSPRNNKRKEREPIDLTGQNRGMIDVTGQNTGTIDLTDDNTGMNGDEQPRKKFSSAQQVIDVDVEQIIDDDDDDAEEKTAEDFISEVKLRAKLADDLEKIFAPVSIEKQVAIKQIFNSSKQNIKQTASVQPKVSIAGFCTLQPGKWLNDEIIDFVFQMLQEKYMDKYFYVPVNIMKLQMSGSKEIVQKYLSKHILQGANFKKWFFPVNINGKHWALLVIDTEKKTIYYCNTMYTANYIDRDGQAFVTAAMNISGLRNLRQEVLKCLQQNDHFNCGVFTLLHAELISLDYDLTLLETQQNFNINNQRWNLASRILTPNWF